MTNFSKLGFIMATLGSSIGLGHIWRFPTMAGLNGGSVFIAIFLLISFGVGISMLVAEMLIGNRTKTNAQDAFAALDESKHKKWHYVGFCIVGGPLILTFYCVVLGWVVYYLGVISTDLPTNMQDSKLLFSQLKENILAQIISLFVVVFLTAYFVAKGVKDGIEKLNFILMPMLFIVFLGLLFYAMSMEHFVDSVKFMFAPDFSKVTAQTLIDSMGQVFFSLSLGIGIVITYAAFTESKQNLFHAALWVVIPGIIISLIAGLTIFTFVFEYKGDVAEGTGLVFITLPVMFAQMGFFGSIVCILFMVGLAFAGISSTISLLEPSIKWLLDKTGKSRGVLTYSVGFVVFVVGCVLIVSLNENALQFGGKSLFEWADWISANILMTFGGILSAVFVGYAIKREHLREWTRDYFSEGMFRFWLFAIKYLAPLMVLCIFTYQIYALIKGK
ncbi:sodium-dependent transporter [Helicobacter saguini]|uniref:Sodium-dependent transporter n=1 Tax=Helicobacter saguini TaxID=1548018 RepID=A0A347VP46_9HELI|nr:sodium-dependent transporter [Helicobacter saguini]MWV61516.1 sodium-dependent transporter [Helicobacter saguini]MWV67814.1 sodium-dependent transporter [Helicobacter saguini]MWV70718.1 sodium-dependent transporter [Helicobacter saguini]MWV72621.1 sodium-dependent transporter [Helicobacter saguini]TLD94570.1 sodium-dependent transporter [Helicobacter saguini]